MEEPPDPARDLAIPAVFMASSDATIIGALSAPPTTNPLSQGLGSGGGAGLGDGKGDGPGRGDGLGPGRQRGIGGDDGRGGGVTDPIPVVRVKPSYTPQAMRARIQGTVWLDAVVTEAGLLTDIQVAQSLDSLLGLDDEAVKAASKWRFIPGRRFGTPVAVAVRLGIDFALH